MARTFRPLYMRRLPRHELVRLPAVRRAAQGASQIVVQPAGAHAYPAVWLGGIAGDNLLRLHAAGNDGPGPDHGKGPDRQAWQDNRAGADGGAAFDTRRPPPVGRVAITVLHLRHPRAA